MCCKLLEFVAVRMAVAFSFFMYGQFQGIHPTYPIFH